MRNAECVIRNWGTGLSCAAKCAFTQSHRLCCVSRREYAGAEMWKPHCGRPRLRQRVFDSLDSLHLIRRHVRFTLGSRLHFTKHRNNRYPRITALTLRRTRVDGKT